MKPISFKSRTTLLVLFIVSTAALRVAFNFSPILSPVSDFSPLGAMALFGGACFKTTWKAFAFPLAMLFLSDVILHETVYRAYSNGLLYNGWLWVYGAFAMMVLAGRVILVKISWRSFLASMLCCVLIHWIVTDIGIWLAFTTYAHDLRGFLNCLAAAIPFEWRFLAGTLVYSIILFGGFEWVGKIYFTSALAEKRQEGTVN